MARRLLSLTDRGRAFAWLQDGKTQRNVAQRLDVRQGVIGRLWQRFWPQEAFIIVHVPEGLDQLLIEKTGM